MMAPLLTPAPANPPGRISQILPSVKCSTCNQPVALSELGEHICKAPPPQAPSLPKPSISPAAASALLPQRLQGRIASPSPPPTGPLPPSPPRAAPPPQRAAPPPADRLRINTSSPGPGNYQARSSPLARSEADGVPFPPRPRDPFAPTTGSPLRTQPPQSMDMRMRAVSNAGSISSTRSAPAPRPSMSSTRDMPPGSPAPPFAQSSADMRRPSLNIPPPSNMGSSPASGGIPPPINRGPSPGGGRPVNPGEPSAGVSTVRFPPGGPGGSFHPRGNSVADFGSPPVIPQPRQMSYVPPTERDIDTKVGGQAGMAGVGRRGFAAAARAAMFVGPGSPQQLQNRHPNGPMYLDINAASSSLETPPLSASSGYSSHSPGPLSPLPQAELVPEPAPEKEPRTPSPSGRYITAQSPMPEKTPTPLAEPVPASPISSVRLPFFEKFKNILPGNANTNEDNNTNSHNNNDTSTVSTPKPGPIPRPESASGKSVSSASFYGSPPARMMSINTTSSRTRRPLSSSSDSDSECGLAYADSTDEEEDTPVERRRVKSPPAPLPLASSSILRSASNSSSSTSTHHVKFPSASDKSSDERTGIKIAGRHHRDGSVSSVSSVDSAPGLKRTRTTSSVIAHALGLSQTPPSEYRKLGGPGVGLGRTLSNGSSASSGSRSANVRGMSIQSNAVLLGGGALHRLMKEHVDDDEEKKEVAVVQGAELVKSKSTSSKVSFGSSISGSVKRMGMVDDKKSKGKEKESVDPPAAPVVVKSVGFADADTTIGEPSGSKTHRSNTVQGPHHHSSETPKLPVRARTTTSSMDGSKREKVKKQRVCMKCDKKIEDGRWIQTDAGGVLCERCWKNMYLPKCRRCNLPIEKQAVSSSDGQLKGKYHKECFNCHSCHKPFPDKTFYVYDGKPLCAYHYHEANDSLCAAARCGQPIEGPCAVSHTGDRYHPEHMICEYPGYPACNERLNEYWEVDGMMLCQNHAQKATIGGSDEEAEEEWVQSSKATKRITRFIDLAQAGGLPGVGAGEKGNDEEEESLR